MTVPSFKYTVGYVDGTFEESGGCSLEYIARILDSAATYRKNDIKTFLVEREKVKR